MTKLKLNPTNVFLGFLFISFLWLADINILTQSYGGFLAKTHVVPNVKIPAFTLVFLSFLVMASIIFRFHKQLKNKKDYNLFFANLFMFSLYLGLFFLVAGCIALLSLGHDSYIWGFSSLGIYHSSLPLLVLSVIGYVLLE